MIFDQLTNEFKVRKESILYKLEEMGYKCNLTELLGLDIFVGTSQGQWSIKSACIQRDFVLFYFNLVLITTTFFIGTWTEQISFFLLN